MDFNWINSQNITVKSDVKNGFDFDSIITKRLVSKHGEQLSKHEEIGLNIVQLSKT